VNAAALELSEVRKRYPPRPDEAAEEAFGPREQPELLRGVTLSVSRGEFVAIEGQSGSGKSTLLHLLGGLDRDYQGTVRVLGHDLRALGDRECAALRQRSIGFVFQSFNLLPQLTALENALLPEAFGEIPDALARARTALLRVGLAHKARARPSQLSGGERQRVAIARALLARPEVLLADEPTGNLDARTGEGIIDLFRELHRGGTTLLIVTHEVRVSRAASRVLLLNEGRLETPRIDPLQTPGEGTRPGDWR
jgi:putative ABC transport system ATP-binding protein